MNTNALATKEWTANRPEIRADFNTDEIISPDEKNLLSGIIDLKAEIAELEERLQSKRRKAVGIIDDLTASGQIKSFIPFSGFEFFVGTKRTFEYSASVVDFDENLKKLKKSEEQSGTAREVKATRFLCVKEAKFQKIQDPSDNALDTVFSKCELCGVEFAGFGNDCGSCAKSN